MTLHQESDIFRQLILLAGQHFNMLPSYVEKDYWVTQMLSHLSASKYANNVVFKGGTSLSKAYHLINRFSEDVDVAVIHEGLTGNAVKTLIRHVEKDIVGDFSPVDDPANSKGSMYRKSIFSYPTIMDNEPGAIATKRMILEISAFANPFPFEVRKVSSLIADYLTVIHREDVIEQYSMHKFTLNVLDVRRTLVEKIVSLIRFSFEEERGLTSKIRHFYDIYYLMQTAECQQYVQAGDFKRDARELLQHDQKSFDSPVGWSDVPLEYTPLLVRFDELWSKIAPSYQTEMSSLAYSPIPPIEDIAQAMHQVLGSL